MKNIKFSDETYNLLFLLKKGKPFDALLNKMANYFIKSELDVFNLRPYSEEAILSELGKMKKDQERIIKILKAQEKDYKALFASKNDLQNITINNPNKEFLSLDFLNEQGLSNEDLAALAIAAQDNTDELAKRDNRIKELERKLAEYSSKNASSQSSSITEFEERLIEMNFYDAFNELLLHEIVTPTGRIEYKKDLFEKLKRVLDITINVESYEVKEAYNKFMETLNYLDIMKIFHTNNITIADYHLYKNRLLALR